MNLLAYWDLNDNPGYDEPYAVYFEDGTDASIDEYRKHIDDTHEDRLDYPGRMVRRIYQASLEASGGVTTHATGRSPEVRSSRFTWISAIRTHQTHRSSPSCTRSRSCTDASSSDLRCRRLTPKAAVAPKANPQSITLCSRA
jgi:hypothetical protein